MDTSPLAMKSVVAKLFEATDAWKINRTVITDPEFILPLHKTENGLFRLSGDQNTHFIRYKVQHLWEYS